MGAGINDDVKMVVKSLKSNKFDPVEFVDEADTAAEIVVDMIPLEATVAVASSTSVRQIGLITRLRRRGTRVIDTMVVPSELPFDEFLRQTLVVDILLTSSNAVTLDGKLVNIDGYGNRAAAMIFGPKKVILVIGVNKIVRDVDEAIHRIKDVIAPYHAMIRGDKTPCAIDLRCNDCKSPGRICNVTTIIEKKPLCSNIGVVLVGEDLGLGWNPDWPKERRERIVSVYRETRRVYSQAVQEAPVKTR